MIHRGLFTHKKNQHTNTLCHAQITVLTGAAWVEISSAISLNWTGWTSSVCWDFSCKTTFLVFEGFKHRKKSGCGDLLDAICSVHPFSFDHISTNLSTIWETWIFQLWQKHFQIPKLLHVSATQTICRSITCYNLAIGGKYPVLKLVEIWEQYMLHSTDNDSPEIGASCGLILTQSLWNQLLKQDVVICSSTESFLQTPAESDFTDWDI